jgi:acetoin:2,6-dichlorophenolindophenol oxidoreductase subunit beta
VPSTPADAKGLLKTAIRGRNPTFFMEASGQGGASGEVPEGDYTVDFGKAAVAREGQDVTVIAIGTMVRPALAAAKQLETQGIGVEVIDPRTLVPLDEDTIVRSVNKTGRAVVVDEGRDRASAASHIAAILADKAFSSLRAPVKRVTVPNVAMPYAPNAEARVFPGEEQIVQAVRATRAPTP